MCLSATGMYKIVISPLKAIQNWPNGSQRLRFVPHPLASFRSTGSRFLTTLRCYLTSKLCPWAGVGTCIFVRRPSARLYQTHLMASTSSKKGAQAQVQATAACAPEPAPGAFALPCIPPYHVVLAVCRGRAAWAYGAEYSGRVQRPSPGAQSMGRVQGPMQEA